MILAIFGFLQLSLADILDILLLALLIYIVFRWIRGTSAMSIFVAIISLYGIRLIVSAFNMRLMTNIMETVLDVGVIAFIVIFQPEIRKFLMRLGSRYISSKQGKAILDRILGKARQSADISKSEAVNDITQACRRMSEDKTGALIVIGHKASLEDIINTGDRIDAAIHRRLIMNLFFKNSPRRSTCHNGRTYCSGKMYITDYRKEQYPRKFRNEAQGCHRHYRRNGCRCNRSI